MNYLATEFEGVWIIEPKIFKDERGYFMEFFKKAEFEKQIGFVSFIQENESQSAKNVLRGLHYQKGDFSQAKLVRVIQGEVLDVVVDLRKSSRTFGRSLQVKLSGENKRQLYVPKGFAHGFAVLSEKAILAYKVDAPYAPQSEVTIAYNDKNLAIDWPIEKEHVILSEKDQKGIAFAAAPYFD